MVFSPIIFLYIFFFPKDALAFIQSGHPHPCKVVYRFQIWKKEHKYWIKKKKNLQVSCGTEFCIGRQSVTGATLMVHNLYDDKIS